MKEQEAVETQVHSGNDISLKPARLWTEKYRPKKFDEIIGQREVADKVKAMLETGNLPHLLFAGPAGTGKTTLALVIANCLYGDAKHGNFMETNASDERGIDVVREKIKEFARTKAIGKVPFKIILLDEADALTKDAQHALRRTMENFSETCRFILDCNYSSKIIEPIQSRCAVFKFKPLNMDLVSGYVDRIAKSEGLVVSVEAKEALYSISEGDLRKVTNILQSCVSLTKHITEKAIYASASFADPHEIRQVVTLAMQGMIRDAKNLLFKIMYEYGLSGIDAIKQLQRTVWEIDMPEKIRAFLIDRIGEFEFRMVEGSDEQVQLEALLAQFMLAGKKDVA